MEVYKSYLKAKYLERKMPHYGKWPPDLPTEKYINMSVIEKRKHTVDDSKAFTYGNIDAVKRKSDIAFKDTARPTRDGVMPKFVLVEGAPGVGKTTFAWEACRKWAEGEILEDFDLVILVRFRDTTVRSAKCLGDLST
jgi:Cdc6-like AAA superfamily ATPase